MLDGGHRDNDDLRDCTNAPAWIRSWQGPFCITVDQLDDRSAGLVLDHLPSVETTTRHKPGLTIPDSDGRYGRGFRDGLDSIRLALSADGISHESIDRAVATALQAYGDNASEGKPREEEIEEVMVVSTAHLTQDERELFERQDVLCEGLIVSMRSEYAFLIFVSGEDEDTASLDALSDKFSAGFVACISRARELGVNFVKFDVDGCQLEGASVYD